MSESNKEVLVIGFGPVGAIYSLILKESGIARVTVVARSNYELLRGEFLPNFMLMPLVSLPDRGIDIKSRKFGTHTAWKPHRVCNSVASAADTQYDYVLVCTKCIPEVQATSDLLQPFLTEPYTTRFQQPVYVLVQNGLHIEKDLYNVAAGIKENYRPKIITVAVFILSNQKSPELIEHDESEQFICGIYRPDDYTTISNSSEELSILNGLGDMLLKGGCDFKIVPEIQRRKFLKNMYNVVFASVCLLTRQPLTSIFRPPPSEGQSYEPYVFPATKHLVDEQTIPLMHAIFKELLTLARALGFPDSEDGIPASIEPHAMQATAASHATPWSFHKPSSLIDLERGRPMELEVIWGSVVRLAKEKRVDVPRVEMTYSLLVVMQNQILRMRASEGAKS